MPQVKLFGNLRRHADASRLEVDGATVNDVLTAICAGNDDLCAAMLDEGELRPYFRVMLNGRDIELEQGLATPVTDSDQVAIFPPLAGG